jgi:hypothetical protein
LLFGWLLSLLLCLSWLLSLLSRSRDWLLSLLFSETFDSFNLGAFATALPEEAEDGAFSGFGRSGTLDPGGRRDATREPTVEAAWREPTPLVEDGPPRFSDLLGCRSIPCSRRSRGFFGPEVVTWRPARLLVADLELLGARGVRETASATLDFWVVGFALELLAGMLGARGVGLTFVLFVVNRRRESRADEAADSVERWSRFEVAATAFPRGVTVVVTRPLVELFEVTVSGFSSMLLDGLLKGATSETSSHPDAAECAARACSSPRPSMQAGHSDAILHVEKVF